MKVKELTLKQKKACILYMIALLIKGKKYYIYHCFSEFVFNKTKILNGVSLEETDVNAEDFMHIIFPELYNELKNLVDNDTTIEKYNSNDSRTGTCNARFRFEEKYKCPIWYTWEIEERVHFLNDLNDSLKK